MSVTIYVEGGGDQRALKSRCRDGFSAFFAKVVPAGQRPKVVACGSRADAFDAFKTALRTGERAVLLLVDAEEPYEPGCPGWQHLRQRPGDHWERPPAATDDHLHLMVRCMEAWFLADRAALAAFFGQGFQESALPGRREVEQIAKADLFSALERATKPSRKGKYGKGEHSFKLLGQIDPRRVAAVSPHVKRLLLALGAQEDALRTAQR